jgi:hypothetical protein
LGERLKEKVKRSVRMPNPGKYSRAEGFESRKDARRIGQSAGNFRPFSKALTLFTER